MNPILEPAGTTRIGEQPDGALQPCPEIQKAKHLRYNPATRGPRIADMADPAPIPPVPHSNTRIYSDPLGHLV